MKSKSNIIVFRGKLHFYYSNNGKILRKNLKIQEKDRNTKANKLIVKNIHNLFNNIIFEYQLKNNFKNPSAEYVKQMLFFPDLVDKNNIIDLYDKFLATIEENNFRKPQSNYAYKNVKENLLDYLDEIKYEKINQKLITGFINYISSTKKKYNIETLRKKIIYFKKFVKYLYDNEYIKFQPKYEIPPFRKVNKQVETLTTTELKYIINKLETTDNERYRRVLSMFLFACFTSLRYSDLIQITKDKVKNRTLHLFTKKTDTELNIKLDDFLMNILENNNYNLFYYSNAMYNKILVSMFSEFSVDLISLSEVIDIRIQHAIGTTTKNVRRCDLITSHMARRIFITLQINMNTPFPEIMRMTGHKSLDLLNEYLDIYNKVKGGDSSNISTKMLDYINQ